MFSAMLGEAWHAMGANRLRTFLTMLGMVIGVGAVVLMMAIGQGAEASVKRSISAMGSHLFVVLSGPPRMGGARTATGNAPSLNVRDANAISELYGVMGVAPVTMGKGQVVYASNNWNTDVIGTTAEYMDIRGWGLSAGYAFSASDTRSATRVALLGKTVVQNLFGDDGEVDPVGKTIRINQRPFVVLGVLDSKGQTLDGRDQDDTIIVPLTTAQRKLFGNQLPGTVRQIMVQAESDNVMSMVEEALNSLLNQRHNIREGADSDFSVRNLTAIANSAAETARTMSLLLGAIASVSLLVGGIGIMNIMLVSVTERTREIGIRLAVGATSAQVLTQFLVEAVVLSILGGVIGIGLGLALAFGAAQFMAIPFAPQASVVALAFCFSALIGVIFGFFPARRAARLDPIEALRHQ